MTTHRILVRVYVLDRVEILELGMSSGTGIMLFAYIRIRVWN